MKLNKNSGFTLIELMIVVAIVAILAAIAYPNYQSQVQKSRRGDAKAVMLENAQFLERNYTMSGRFDTLPGGGAVTDANLPYQTAPRDGTAFYDISFSAGPAASSYELQAVPRAGQDDDGCGTLTLSHSGVKTASDGDVADCWAR